MKTFIFPKRGFRHRQRDFAPGRGHDGMIAKHIKMKDTGKSRVLRLVEYITDKQEKAHRVGDIFIANCISDDPHMAAREMYTTQQKNSRGSGGKTYHLLISFRPGEEPGRDVIRRIEDEICRGLGFAEHQRVAVVHKDTDSVHLHVAINMIHPRKLTVRDPFRDHFTLGRISSDLENKYRLEQDNHIPSGKTYAERSAGDIETMTGQESLLSWIKRECLPAMRLAESWDALHTVLAGAGLKIALRGNGLAITAASGSKVTGSKIDRMFSKENLEKRFGAFTPEPETVKNIRPSKTYGRDPVPAGRNAILAQEYRESREAAAAERQGRLDAIAAEYRRKTAALRRELAADWAEARRIKAGRAAKRKLVAALRRKQKAGLNRIRQEAGQARKAVFREAGNLSWLSWLQEQAKAGRAEALAALRSRALAQAGKTGLHIRGVGNAAACPALAGLPVDAVTKRGTVIYRVGDEAVRDDGESFRVSRESGQDTLVLAFKMAKKRYGDVLAVAADPDFQNRVVRAAVAGGVRVTFAEPALEAKRRIAVTATGVTTAKAAVHHHTKTKGHER